MSGNDQTIMVTVRGGQYDGDIFPMPLSEAEVGTVFNYQGTQLTLSRSGGSWVALQAGDP